ncbi:hypothetical protein HPB48_012487 [Haemaphysalis longicornis]|uniref:Uncharacterized protein n=1 Tax=Haemaphysalis longicornis TaxID=44386 RepID=A0A9J6H1K2_HAELO|nr:hypothetical protein HPB48_012487 [Haemaphysalis longicornis]
MCIQENQDCFFDPDEDSSPSESASQPRVLEKNRDYECTGLAVRVASHFHGVAGRRPGTASPACQTADGCCLAPSRPCHRRCQAEPAGEPSATPTSKGERSALSTAETRKGRFLEGVC